MKKRRQVKRRKKVNRPKRTVLVVAIFLLFGCIYYYWPSNYYIGETIKQNQTLSEDEFIARIGKIAQDNYKNSHVLPSVVIAQAILESDFGKSQLATDYYNLFGRKAYGSEKGVSLETQEYAYGEYVTINDRFKVYHSWREAIEDHGRLMKNGTDWNKDLYSGVTSATVYQEATNALQQAGYATDPTYATKLDQLIQNYHLTKYDMSI